MPEDERPNARPAKVVVWLDDDPTDDRIRRPRTQLGKLGYDVRLARGFRELDAIFYQLCEASGAPSEQIVAVIIDIMIENVTSLSGFYPWVVDAKTRYGFAAGLVFLERVFSPQQRSERDKIFGKFQSVPVIVYSMRALVEDELPRYKVLRQRRSADTELLVKEPDGELVKKVERLAAPRT